MKHVEDAWFHLWAIGSIWLSVVLASNGSTYSLYLKTHFEQTLFNEFDYILNEFDHIFNGLYGLV